MSVFIKSLHLKNILSFKDTKLDLQPLNVLIGPNGSGKSNLIDVVGLLQAAPYDVTEHLRRNGPTGDWIWKGHSNSESLFQTAGVVADLASSNAVPWHNHDCRYDLAIVVHDDRVLTLTEHLDFVAGEPNQKTPAHPLFNSSNESAWLWPTRIDGTLADYDDAPVEVDVSRGRSVLSEVRSHADYPALTQTARSLSSIKSYRNWYVGRDSPVRHAQRTDGDPNFLAEDFSNLALVVNDLLSRRLEPSLNDYLKRFYESYESIHPRIFGNTIELIVNEAGLGSSLPASRLSDGTIRFIALLAILCHPDPPPLICIEEPEIAMHPDSQDLVVELLIEASQRTQLIVTTHSPWLIDRLSAQPDSVVVCERDRHPADGTQFKRFTREQLEDWLEDQPLGEVWMAGAIGGVH